MAKASERDRYKYGVCTNRDKDGKPCPKCDSKEVQKIRMGQDFVCEECKEAIRQVPPPKQSSSLGKIIGIVTVIIIVCSGVAAYFIFGKSESQPILVSSISLNETSVTLDEGESHFVEASFLPIDAENKIIIWSSSDPTVATINDGNITALKAGSTTIKAEIKDESSLSTDCEVIVQKITSEPEKIENVEMGKDKIKKENPNPTMPQSSIDTTLGGKTTITINGNRYIGQVKGGKAHGQGTLTYNSRTLISKRDMKNRYAEAGQYVIGEFYEGELVHGTLYDRNNDPIEQIRIGR